MVSTSDRTRSAIRNTASAFRNDTVREAYFSKFVPNRMARCARDLITEYYRAMAQDHGKTQARFFAEKGNNLHRPTRMFTRRAFGETRELVIVRDPRDVLCSHMTYFGSTPEKAFSDLTGSVRQLISIHGEHRPDIHMLRYEDLVRGDAACLAALSAFLGTPIAPAPAQDAQRVFRAHATSPSPAASIGRWQTDLPEPTRTRSTQEWSSLLTLFAYAPS